MQFLGLKFNLGPRSSLYVNLSPPEVKEKHQKRTILVDIATWTCLIKLLLLSYRFNSHWVQLISLIVILFAEVQIKKYGKIDDIYLFTEKSFTDSNITSF